MEEPAFQSQRSGHAGFFVDGEEGVDRRVRNVLGIEDGQNGCDTDAVVRAQCGAFSSHPITVDVHLDALGVEIELRIGVFLANHVQVALQDDVSFGFHPRCCRLANQHIAHRIGQCLEPPVLTQSNDPFADALFFF